MRNVEHVDGVPLPHFFLVLLLRISKFELVGLYMRNPYAYA